MEKDRLATQPLEQKSYLVCISQRAKGTRRPQHSHGGLAEQSTSMKPLKGGDQSNGICMGRGTVLKLSGAPNRPHSSSQRLVSCKHAWLKHTGHTYG